MGPPPYAARRGEWYEGEYMMLQWLLRVAVGVLPAVCGIPTLASVMGHAPGAMRPASVTPCLGTSLRGRAGWQGATGSLLGAIILTNRGPRQCVLRGQPVLLLLAHGGEVLPVRQAVLSPGTAGAGHFGAAEAIVAPGHSARVLLDWANWCGGRLGAVTVIFALPDGLGGFALIARDARGAPVLAMPRCDSLTSASVLRVGSFEPMVP